MMLNRYIVQGIVQDLAAGRNVAVIADESAREQVRQVRALLAQHPDSPSLRLTLASGREELEHRSHARAWFTTPGGADGKLRGKTWQVTVLLSDLWELDGTRRALLRELIHAGTASSLDAEQIL
ncbi:hypothetical protein [Serinicoccus sediminis]|uniref:hypothetical protein n=1 Tax=Serinicoccus sediminis TaxID=2306021 RepID=UPI001020DDE4|nr:hypothetical protein [Serinicoccus sediminis]